jgi:hypothetical protein
LRKSNESKGKTKMVMRKSKGDAKKCKKKMRKDAEREKRVFIILRFKG